MCMFITKIHNIRGPITLCSKKSKPFIFENNFGKCEQIFEILLPGDS